MDEESIIEEQSNEMEVLGSMYEREMIVLSDSPHSFTMEISSKIDQEAVTPNASITIQFSFTKQYPHEAPRYEVISSKNLEKNSEHEIIDMIDKSIDSNVGEAMIYNFIIATEDKIFEILELLDTGRKLEILRIEKEQFDLEQKKFEGQIVTIESFLTWKKAFNAEIDLKDKKLQAKIDKDANKLSGKELFMSDLTMDNSDVKFLEQENDIEIDEALFDDDFEVDDDLSD